LKAISVVLLSLLFGSFFLVMAGAQQEQVPPITIHWTVLAGDTKKLEIAELMKKELTQIGVNVQIESLEKASYFAHTYFSPGLTWDDGGMDADYMGYSWMLTDYVWYIGCYASEGLPPVGWNYWAWTNGVADNLLRAGMGSYNTTERLQHLNAWQEMHQEDVGTIIVGYPLYAQMTRKEVKGYSGMYRAYDAGNWTVEGKTRADQVIVKYASHPTTGFVTGLLPFYLGTGYIQQNTLYRSLYQVGLTPDGKYAAVPDMAESVEFSSDGMAATFHLRRDIKWHDGVPFTSKDVKYTFDAILDPKTEAEYYGDFSAAVKSVEAPDDYTVVLHLAKKSPELTTLVMTSYSMIVPEHVLGKISNDKLKTSEYNTKTPPPGTGPFKFKAWTRAESFEVEAFDGFYRGAPFLKGIVFETVTEPMTALSALRARDVDMMDIYFSTDIPDEVPKVEADPAFHVERIPYPRTLFIALNHKHPVLANPLVRQAIAYLVPYEQIRDVVYKGMLQLGNSPIHPATWGWNPKAPSYTYDPAKAKELMAKAAYSPWPPPEVVTPEAVIPASAYVIPVLGGLVVGLIVGFGAAAVVMRKRKAE